ncbi:MAG: protease modulator HflK [Victivallaceae bacterium]|nr:protease modulator HflK [Victivallaceae bacterium]
MAQDVNPAPENGRYEKGLEALTRSLRTAFVLLLAAIAITLVYFVTGGGYFSVDPQQAVIVLRFGRAVDCHSTGAHWYIPYPVHSFVRVYTGQQYLTVDLRTLETGEDKAPRSLTPGRDEYLITGDANIVHASWHIGYRVSNPVKYYLSLSTPPRPVDNNRIQDDVEETDGDGVKGTRGPVKMLRSMFRGALLEVTSSERVDSVLSSGQGAYSERVRTAFSRRVDAADCGLEITSVTLNRVYPPGATKSAFDEVTAASNTRDTLRNEAHAYGIGVKNETLSRKAEILAEAKTYRSRTVALLKSESEYFDSIRAEYEKNPKTVLTSLYTDALGEALEGADGGGFVLGTSRKGRKEVRIRLNQEAPKREKTTEAEK